MTLRDLSDLELAALLGFLNEAAAAAGAINLHPNPFVNAVRSATREVLGRRSGAACVDELFPAQARMPEALDEVIGLASFGAEQLKEKGFDQAAALLAARAASEIASRGGRAEGGTPCLARAKLNGSETLH